MFVVAIKVLDRTFKRERVMKKKSQLFGFHTLTGVCSVLAALFAIFIFSKIILMRPSRKERVYSYVGDDYPANFPISRDSEIATAMDETVHYGIFETESLEEWATNQAEGRGYVKLGPEKRGFAISMFHQLHCLRVIRWALSGHYDSYAMGHVQHCLNYLRQEILCSADLTLEPHDILTRDHEVERAGAVHICRDWRVLYNDLGINWQEWVDFRESHGEGILPDPGFSHT